MIGGVGRHDGDHLGHGCQHHQCSLDQGREWEYDDSGYDQDTQQHEQQVAPAALGESGSGDFGDDVRLALGGCHEDIGPSSGASR